jgi:glycosyltransferase involved in cell wall biosynthesis
MPPATDRPLVTFAVIAYNQERFIREAVEGAFAQTYQPLEIILSDDGSPDRTYEIMQEMAAGYDGPHKVVLNRNEPNLGLVPHIDRVMELISGEFIVVNAGDDVSVPERTERLAGAWLASGRKAKMVHSATRRSDVEGRLKEIKRPSRQIIDTPTAAAIICDRLFVIGATAAWDRDIYDTFGPLGTKVATEDRILPFRAALLGNLAYVDEPLVRWRDGGVSEGSDRMTGQAFLYGIWHRGRKWAVTIDQHILDCYKNANYPDKARIETICRNRIPRLNLAINLAESSRLARLGMGLRALRLSFAQRSTEPLKYWIYYVFDWLYMPYASWKSARRSRSEQNRRSGSGDKYYEHS